MFKSYSPHELWPPLSCSSSKSENSNSDRSHSLTPPAKRGVGMRPLATNLSKWVAERPTNKLACTLRSPDGVINILSLGIEYLLYPGRWYRLNCIPILCTPCFTWRNVHCLLNWWHDDVGVCPRVLPAWDWQPTPYVLRWTIWLISYWCHCVSSFWYFTAILKNMIANSVNNYLLELMTPALMRRLT